MALPYSMTPRSIWVRARLAAPSEAGGWKSETRIGDVDAAMASAAHSVDQLYSTPYHFSQPMEPNACLADWRDGHLTLFLTAQMLNQLIVGLAATLKLDRSHITIDSAYVGGGFGSKIVLHAEDFLAPVDIGDRHNHLTIETARTQ